MNTADGRHVKRQRQQKRVQTVGLQAYLLKQLLDQLLPVGGKARRRVLFRMQNGAAPGQESPESGGAAKLCPAGFGWVVPAVP